MCHPQDLLKSAGSGRCGGKSEGESRRWRDAGNKHFQVSDSLLFGLDSFALFVVGLLYFHANLPCQAGRDMDAVRRFNQAVAAAPQQEGRGRDLSLAFANRLADIIFLGRF